MRVGYFGGSFDPIHRGHVELARHILRAESLDKLVFLPARQAPHKKSGPGASGSHRLMMLGLALRGETGLSIDGRELDRAGPSYTFDTMRMIKDESPDDQLFFLIGLDSLGDLNQWHRIDELAKLVIFLVARRPGEHRDDMEAAARENSAIRYELLETPEIQASSREIKRRLASGQPVDEYLAPSVEAYIREHLLYDVPSSPASS
ncbi:MAG: nicotinate-nucleotide adenylyltransferase [Planctomycetota bacterium]